MGPADGSGSEIESGASADSTKCAACGSEFIMRALGLTRAADVARVHVDAKLVCCWRAQYHIGRVLF